MKATIRHKKKMARLIFTNNQITIIAPSKREKLWIRMCLRIYSIALDIRLKRTEKGYTVRKEDIYKVEFKLIPALKAIGK